MLAVLVLALLVGVASAIAEGGDLDGQEGPTTEDYTESLALPGAADFAPSTDPQASESLPHGDLDRQGASRLLTAVFEESLDAPAGVFDDLQVERFYSDHVAVVAEDKSFLGIPGLSTHRGLLQSLLPLRVENAAGQKAAVDLDLEHTDGELQPTNPLVEVSIPDELGKGIALPQAGIELRLAGAPTERAPSVVDESTAFFPNVAEDSDFMVLATPTGFEAFSQLRTPDAPATQTYSLGLPAGASLQETSEGGARVTADGEIIATVPPPTAIDAEGEPVPVSLDVEGSSLIVTSAPAPGAAYPILVDPVMETYYWALNNHTDGIGDWVAASNSPHFEARPYGFGGGEKGLNIYSYWGTVQPGAQANWNYHVPRFYSDYSTYGERPTTFINRMTLSGVNWWIENESAPYKPNPFVLVGLWDSNKGEWASLGTRTGTAGQMFNATLDLKNPNENTDVKEGGIAMHAAEDTQSRHRHLWVGQASVELSDKDTPAFAAIKGPSKWVNGSNEKGAVTEAIDFTVSDPGLGVSAMLAKSPKAGGGTNQWEQVVGCVGNYRNPCPRSWKGGYWNYNPKLMPQGEVMVEMIGKDPIGHFSDQAGLQAYAKVKVDRTAPTLALSGSLTQQTTVGTWLPSYSLKMDVADGTEAAPQSGAAKVVVKVDESVVYESAPGCTPKNCAFSREWTMDADDFSYGLHRVDVIATDAVGMEKVSSFYVTTHGDQASPSLALSGSMTQQAFLGTTRPSYKLNVNATDPGSAEERKSGVAATTIKVDGTAVDSASPGCLAGGCSVSREWTLNSDSYSVGPHTVEVKATDEAGRSTTKTLTINIARDTTAPQLQATSGLYTAPEGWLEQKAVAYQATATDANGYGVTSVTLKIDGNVVKEASGTCPAGNCTRILGLGQTIDMTSFEGGAHPAELLAVDGAGNNAKRKWTINVSPDGAISASEAEDTLEAFDATSPVNTVGLPVSEVAYEGTTEGLGLHPEGDLLVVQGSAAPTAISSDTPGELEVETPTPTPDTACPNRPAEEVEEPLTGAEEEQLAMTVGCEELPVIPSENDLLTPVSVTPVSGIDGEAQSITPNSAAAVAENVAPSVDLVTRPLFDGAMTFTAIRDASALESFSWRVQLDEDQTLTLKDSKTVEVAYAGGHVAFTITAVPAHDAIGTAIPTSLSVAGDVLTLHVGHRSGSFVYPVVGGAGWEGGFQTHEVIMPPPEGSEEGEASEEEFAEEGVYREVTFGPPQPAVGPVPLKADVGNSKTRRYNFHDCRFRPNGGVAEPPSGSGGGRRRAAIRKCHGESDGPYGEYFTLGWAISMHGTYEYEPERFVWINKRPDCDKWGPDQPAKLRCVGGEYGVGKLHFPRLDLLGYFRFGPGRFGTGEGAGNPVCFLLNGVLPNRHVKQEGGGKVLEETFHTYKELKDKNDPCDWQNMKKIQ